MDVLVELFVATLVALAAAAFAHIGAPFGDGDGGEARSVRRTSVAAAAPAPERVVTLVSEECDEDKVEAVIHAQAETDAAGVAAAVATAMAEAESDVEAAVRAADMARAWAEREAERAEALADRAEALAERRAEQAAA